jgi:hypothetical protein
MTIIGITLRPVPAMTDAQVAAYRKAHPAAAARIDAEIAAAQRDAGMYHTDQNDAAYWLEALVTQHDMTPTHLRDRDAVFDTLDHHAQMQGLTGDDKTDIHLWTRVADAALWLADLLVLDAATENRITTSAVRAHLRAHLTATYGDCTKEDREQIDQYIDDAEEQTGAVWGRAPYATLDIICDDFMVYRGADV